MKRISILLTILFSACLSYGQNGFSFVTSDTKEARRIADSIALTGVRDFKLEREINYSEAKQLSFTYVSSDVQTNYHKDVIKMYKEVGLIKNFKPEKVRMTVYFDVYKNADGSNKYRFSKVEDCKFEDLFAFWVRHIQPDAVAKEVYNTGSSHASIGDNRPFGLVDRGGNWGLYLGFD